MQIDTHGPKKNPDNGEEYPFNRKKPNKLNLAINAAG